MRDICITFRIGDYIGALIAILTSFEAVQSHRDELAIEQRVEQVLEGLTDARFRHWYLP